MKLIVITIITVALVSLAMLWIANKRLPSSIGLENGQFVPCSNTPNCVSSESTRSDQYIKPYDISGVEHPLALIRSIALSIPKAKIISDQENYLHITFRSKIFSFVDDAEFYYDRDKEIIQVRSAARVGYSDLGVNRKRVEWIRQQLTDSPPTKNKNFH
jgi:uncharacterized protein (DUF1499 family)